MIIPVTHFSSLSKPTTIWSKPKVDLLCQTLCCKLDFCTLAIVWSKINLFDHGMANPKSAQVSRTESISRIERHIFTGNSRPLMEIQFSSNLQSSYFSIFMIFMLYDIDSVLGICECYHTLIYNIKVKSSKTILGFP